MHFMLHFFVLFSFLHFPAVFPARTAPTVTTIPTVLTVDANDANTTTWRDFAKFVNLQKGSRLPGVCDLKQYFHRFGYLQAAEDKAANFSDDFDADLESAILSYQKNLGLQVTGRLDTDTIELIMAPRCGLDDSNSRGSNHTHPKLVHTTRNYAYFAGRPRWAEPKPMTLTYALDNNHMISYLTQDEIKSVFARAFARWSDVIPVNFTEAQNYRKADIKIGFFSGDHGDGEPFDGVLGVLAHAFSPENGRLHLDGAETWAVDFDKQRSSVAIDLESVATHEIGHILGLAHSSVKDAIMYPSLRPRSKKVNLRIDDVEGVQYLYGSNPNFNYGSLLETETSGGRRGGGEVFWFLTCCWWIIVIGMVQFVVL